MLTKKDLELIQKMFETQKIDIKEMIQENTNSLVELITAGFHMQDAGFNKSDKMLNNHEQRIGALERKFF